ncbi:MAG: dTDP-4-dehydrorhamnose reductase [Agriterribacter sp.]
MQKPIIVVTGANGQLGQCIQDIATSNNNFDFIFLSKSDLSIEDEVAVNEFFKKTTPAFCVNCAAYTAVDLAETDKERAFAVNAYAVGVLAKICGSYGTRFIHISTDYVFKGDSPIPYKENAPTAPINVYGASKAKGEELAMAQNAGAIVIRTSWVYSEHGKNFVKTMLKHMQERESINVVNDQTGSPTYAPDLAKAILQIIHAGATKPGIYHYCNAGTITWFEFAQEIKELSGSHCQVNPIPSSSYSTPAKRPAYSILDTTAITQAYGIEMRPWKESLKTCIKRLG